MRALAICNQKGGTGKTCTCTALAQAAALNGRKTLAIDLDPQANFSFNLKAATGPNMPGSYELLSGQATAKQCIQSLGSNLDAIPASWTLQTITAEPGAARRLQDALEGISSRYDCIVIDTPPTPGILQLNALQAATDLVVPMQSDIYNLQSLAQIVTTAQQIKKTNKKLKLTGIVLTQYNPRSILARQMEKTIEKAAEQYHTVILGRIRSAVAVREAATMQKSIFEYCPRSKPTKDYLELYKTIFK